MFLLVVLFVIVGDFIDAVPAIIIFMPIITKLTEVGHINPLHMGVVIITTLVFGLITPPYGLSLLVASKYVGVGFGQAVVRSLPLYACSSRPSPSSSSSPTSCWAAEAAAARDRWAASRARPAPATSVRRSIGAKLRCRHGCSLRSSARHPAADAASLGAEHPRRRVLSTASTSGVSRASTDAFLRHQVLLFRAAGPAAGRPGRVRPPLRRGAGARDVAVPRRRPSRSCTGCRTSTRQGRPNGKHPDKGTLAWHTDGSWSRVTGQATIIYGEVVPGIGGETHFCRHVRRL